MSTPAPSTGRHEQAGVHEHAGGLASARILVIARRALIVFAYAAATALMLWPLVNYSALATASYAGDARQHIWTLAWNNHALLSGLPLFDSNIFYPARASLAYNEHHFSVSLFTLPLYAATANPVLAYNVVWLLSFFLSGLATHLLLKRYCGSDTAAFAGSLVLTFSFYKMLHGHGHLGLVWTWPLPLTVLLLERWADRPGLGRAALWGGAVAFQSLTSWYLAVMTALVQGVALAWWAPAWIRAGQFRRIWHLGVVGLLVAGVVWPFAAPYRVLPSLEVAEVSRNSADLAAYLIPPENTWAGRLWRSYVGPGPRWIWGERTLFVGWTALALGIAGVWELVRQRRLRILGLYGTLIVAAFTLSLGPGSSLYSAFAWLPGLAAFRAPARFSLVVLLGLSVFVAFGARLLQDARRSGRVILALLVPLMLSEWYVVGFPAGKPQPFDIPAIYRLDAVRNAHALVSLPDYRGSDAWYLGADYLYFSTAHWRPIANGFGRSEPPDHAHVISHMNAFPGPNNARTMRRLGIDVVVLHTHRIPEGADRIVEVALETGEYDLVARSGPDYAFRVRPAPQ